MILNMTFLGYGAGLGVVGFVCGLAFNVLIRALNIGPKGW